MILLGLWFLHMNAQKFCNKKPTVSPQTAGLSKRGLSDEKCLLTTIMSIDCRGENMVKFDFYIESFL